MEKARTWGNKSPVFLLVFQTRLIEMTTITASKSASLLVALQRDVVRGSGGLLRCMYAQSSCGVGRRLLSSSNLNTTHTSQAAIKNAIIPSNELRTPNFRAGFSVFNPFLRGLSQVENFQQLQLIRHYASATSVGKIENVGRLHNTQTTAAMTDVGHHHVDASHATTEGVHDAEGYEPGGYLFGEKVRRLV